MATCANLENGQTGCFAFLHTQDTSGQTYPHVGFQIDNENPRVATIGSLEAAFDRPGTVVPRILRPHSHELPGARRGRQTMGARREHVDRASFVLRLDRVFDPSFPRNLRSETAT